MSQKSLANWLKVMIVGVGSCAVFVYALVFPQLGQELLPFATDATLRRLWLILVGITAIPCYVSLYFSWNIMTNIGNDVSFTMENARLLHKISVLGAVDVLYVFIWNLFLFILGKNPVVMMTVFLLVAFLGVVITIIFAALAHLVKKAAVLQEQSDYTI